MRRVALLLLLAGCGGGTRPDGGAATSLECVPFARAESGIVLYGDAADWWEEAVGRYSRGATPEPGGVLVFARTGRLPHGHVSVVASVRGPREITVDHANWVNGRIGRDETVQDVSDANDWSAVRVWWSPSAALGARAYPVRGFVGPR